MCDLIKTMKTKSEIQKRIEDLKSANASLYADITLCQSDSGKIIMTEIFNENAQAIIELEWVLGS